MLTNYHVNRLANCYSNLVVPFFNELLALPVFHQNVSIRNSSYTLNRLHAWLITNLPDIFRRKELSVLTWNISSKRLYVEKHLRFLKWELKWACCNYQSIWDFSNYLTWQLYYYIYIIRCSVNCDDYASAWTDHIFTINQ